MYQITTSYDIKIEPGFRCHLFSLWSPVCVPRAAEGHGSRGEKGNAWDFSRERGHCPGRWVRCLWTLQESMEGNPVISELGCYVLFQLHLFKSVADWPVWCWIQHFPATECRLSASTPSLWVELPWDWVTHLPSFWVSGFQEVVLCL